jgi:hypothetical protein
MSRRSSAITRARSFYDITCDWCLDRISNFATDWDEAEGLARREGWLITEGYYDTCPNCARGGRS